LAGATGTAVAAATTLVQADVAAAAAAQSLVNLTQANQTNFQETATLTVLPPIPDPDLRAHFIANLAHMPTRNDSLNLSVSNGLLNSAAVTSADQTPNIIITAANTAITLATMGAGGGPFAAMIIKPQAVLATSACTPDNWSTVFDPVNFNEVTIATQTFASKTQNMKLEADIAKLPAAPPAINPPGGSSVAGLAYRTMTATTITLVSQGNTTAPAPGNSCPLQSPPSAQSVVAVVPDTTTAFLVPAQAGAFTASTFNFGFTNGSLTTYGNQQPSEIAAVVGIPLSIAQSLLSIPAQILQLKVNYDTQATALVNARTQFNQSQANASAAMITAQTQLIQAQTALAQAQIGGPTAIVTAQTALLKAIQALQAAAAAQTAAPTQ